jgi:hypothetical protein
VFFFLLGACSQSEDGTQGGGVIVDDSGIIIDQDGGPTDDTNIYVQPDIWVGDCEPGDKTCSGPFAVIECIATEVEENSWYESTCDDEQGCVDGACIPWICDPLESKLVCIDDNSYERCNASGSAWEIVECGAGSDCKQGICIQLLCVPDTTICKGFNATQICNADGSKWVDGEDCIQGGACWDGECLSPCEVNIKDGSYLGCEYWALDLDNTEGSESQVVGVVVSVPANTSPTTVQITNFATGQILSEAQLKVTSLEILPGELRVFELPLGFDIQGTVMTQNTFQIITTSPVVVHQFNPLNGEGVYTNDASLLLPSKVTGQRYYVMSWPHRNDGQFTLRGFATVVATEEGLTHVKVEPTSNVIAGPGIAQLEAGSKYLFVLEQGQALNFETDGDHGSDLTGTYIEADQKITVMGGHECANVPVGIEACDHLEQQLFPLETWSTKYIADAFKARSPSQLDVWRVMAGANDVIVTTNPPVPGYETFMLQRGSWLQFASGDSFVIEGDGPLMVGHYLSGSSYPGAEIVCLESDDAIGDPAFTLAAPAKRFLKEYLVLTPEGYLENYVNVTVPDGVSVTIDGQPLTAPIVPITGTGYGVAQQPVQPGVHTVSGSKAFGLTAYGYDCDVSYAYPGGLKLQALGGEE